MAEPARISVAIPSYNHAGYVGRAVESALRQTRPPAEVVIVDDGSTDGSAELLRARYAGEPRVRIVARENRGAHRTLDEAIRLCTGDYVAILNSDDEFLPTRFERMLAAAERSAAPFFGISGLRVVDDRGEPAPGTIAADYYDAVVRRAAGEPPSAALWVGNLAMTTSNFFFSRDVHDAVGPFAPLRYTHDWDWALRASERFGVHRVDEPLLLYRTHGANTISEVADWKKVVEHAYVFAGVLRRTGLDGLARAEGISEGAVLRALAKNRSFRPVPTLFFLGLRHDDAALEAALVEGRLEAMLRELVEGGGRRFELYAPAAQLDETLARQDDVPRLLWHLRPLRRARKVLRAWRREKAR